MYAESTQAKKQLNDAYKHYENALKWNSSILPQAKELYLKKKANYEKLPNEFADKHHLPVNLINMFLEGEIVQPMWLLKLIFNNKQYASNQESNRLLAELLSINNFEIIDTAFNHNDPHALLTDEYYKFAKEIANDVIDMKPYLLKDQSTATQIECLSFLDKIYSSACIILGRLQSFLGKQNIEFDKDALEAYWPILNNLHKNIVSFINANTDKKFLLEDTILIKILRVTRHEIKAAMEVVEGQLANFEMERESKFSKS